MFHSRVCAVFVSGSAVRGLHRSTESRERLLIRLMTSKSSREASSYDCGPSVNPVELTESHVAQICCVPNDDIKTVFPSSLPRHFTAEVNALGQTCWLLRRQSYEIINELKEYDSSQTHKFRYLLYGNSGTGKTMCLHQILHYCVKAGWLVIFIPGVFLWTQSGKEVRPSTHLPGTYDQPEAAATWLKTFRTLNSHFTSQLHLSRDWEWSKKEHSSAGEEVNKVIDKGLLKPVLATEVVSALLQELVTASHRFKMILAVDEFNGCFNPTTLKTQQKEWVLPHQLNLVRSLVQHIHQFPGAVLLALSRSRMLRCSVTGWTPDDLLMTAAVSTESRTESEVVLKSCRTVEIPPYSRQEMERCLHYLSQSRWVNTELSPAVINEMWYLTSGSPCTLHRICASL